jgi:hypothetical protein
MALFDDQDFEEVGQVNEKIPDGLVDITDVVSITERLGFWLKTLDPRSIEAPASQLSDSLFDNGFLSQIHSSDGEPCELESKMLVAASSCFTHVVALVGDLPIDELTSHLYEKLVGLGHDRQIVSEILSDLCEVINEDTSVAREVFLMRVVNRACEGEDWPTPETSRRLINLFLTMLLAVLFDGLDEFARSIVFQELDELVVRTSQDKVLPYYLDQEDDSE